MTWRTLVVGDPHGEASDLDDLRALFGLLEGLSEEHRATLVFLGDQHDSHAIVHAEVMAAWRQFLAGRPRDTVMLRGNHDAPAYSKTGAHTLVAYEDLCRVVAEPAVFHDVLFLPYYKAPDEFVAACRKFGNLKTAVCHQAFDGSTYDNGFPAKGEAKPWEVPQEHVISGHIHGPAEFGKVWHPGAPRWRTESDASTAERFVWLVDFEGGVPVKKVPFATGGAVRRILKLVDSPAKPAEPGPWNPKDDVRVDVRGPRERVVARAALHRAAGAVVRELPDAERKSEVRESDGVGVAWAKWLGGFKPPRGTPPAVLQKMVRERVGEEAAAV